MKYVVSISRRTDIPKWHTDWLLEALHRGVATYEHPGAGRRTVSLRPEDVHSLVFWSKDYGPLLEDVELRQVLEAYSVYFHFTVTGLGGSFVEPRVPDASETLAQVGELARIWGAERINWRFDPIVHWAHDSGEVSSNVRYFGELAEPMTRVGISRCTFSFSFWYAKCITRAQRYNFRYVDPSDNEKRGILLTMAKKAASLGMTLYSCAADKWTSIPEVRKSRCIDGDLLARLHPNQEMTIGGKDKSQRKECGCTPSVDIGSYSQRCLHGCLYCYANPIV